MPVVKVAKAIKDVPIGAIIEATATDPGTSRYPCLGPRTTGNEVIKMEREANWSILRAGRSNEIRMLLISR